jgi:aspartokinase/homoserine dehydrogenase 1
MIVQKFGGTSLGSPTALAAAVHRVAEGRPLAVVVSAFGHTTDVLLRRARGEPDDTDLVALHRDGIHAAAARLGVAVPEADALAAEAFAQATGPVRDDAGVDRLLALGELAAAPLFAALLRAVGIPARAVDLRAHLQTDDRFGNARADLGVTLSALRGLAASRGPDVLILPGFVGRTPDGQTTTLGRNGSDYTAALVAAGFGAARVETWTDVPGVLTADPGRIPDARPVPALSWAQAAALAGAGLRMFHPRAIRLLQAHAIELHIRQTERPEVPGTRIGPLAGDGCAVAGPLLSWIRVDGEPSALVPRLAAALGRVGARVNAWYEPSPGAAAVLVDADDAVPAERVFRATLAADLTTGAVRAIDVLPAVQLAVVGAAIPPIPDALTELRAGALTHIVVPAAVADRALRRIHRRVLRQPDRRSVVVLGKGAVAQSLFGLLAGHPTLEVTGIADRRSWITGDDLLATDWRTSLAGAPDRPDRVALLEAAGAERPILVDLTATDTGALYADALARGFDIVTANKVVPAGPAARWEALRLAASASGRTLRYETTVGAALPVLRTLADLVQTGDQIHRVEGSLSGTLGWLCGRVDAGQRLSDAVLDAWDAGYTEPDPRDDLSGADVARKAVILAREAGFSAACRDIRLEPLVDGALPQGRDALGARLREHDPQWRARAEQARPRVWRYLAQLTPDHIRVAPVEVDATHPAATLHGAEALVAFWTARYGDRPLVVRGAGAGPLVTAGGVLADLLR